MSDLGRIGSWSVVLLAVLMACAPSPGMTGGGQTTETAQASAAKRITAAIRGDPTTLVDAVNAAGGGRVAGVEDVEQLLHAGLVQVDGQGQLRPQLAREVPSIENGTWKLFPDGRMETSWKIKPTARWHDGTPITAADYVFTGKVAADKSLTLRQDAAQAFIDRVEAPDAETVLVRWKGVFVDADTLFSRTQESRILAMPAHLLEQAYAEDKTTFTYAPYWTQGYVGAGPYKLRDWTPGSHLVMLANDDYVLGKPKIREIEVRFLWDTNTIVSNLLGGSIDLTLGAGLTVEQAVLVREQWSGGRVEMPLETMTGLWPQFINSQPPAMGDVRFRRALLHAIDRQQIIDTFLGGLVPVAHSLMGPDHPEFSEVDPRVVRYDYDPRRAVQLIEAVGFIPGPDGAFREGAGPLIVETRTTAHDLREKLLFVLADSWQRVGVAMDPVIIPRQRAADREYRATSKSFDFRFNPLEVNRYHSSQIPLPDNNYRGNNSARYGSAELDALLEGHMTAIDKKERTRLLGSIMHHMTDQLVVVPLFHDAQPIFISHSLLNVGGKKGDALQGWNAQEWDFK